MDKKMQIRNSTADFLVFAKGNREDSIEVRVHDEDVWLTQKSMAQLFECSTDNSGLHLKKHFCQRRVGRRSSYREILGNCF